MVPRVTGSNPVFHPIFFSRELAKRQIHKLWPTFKSSQTTWNKRLRGFFVSTGNSLRCGLPTDFKRFLQNRSFSQQYSRQVLRFSEVRTTIWNKRQAIQDAFRIRGFRGSDSHPTYSNTLFLIPAALKASNRSPLFSWRKKRLTHRLFGFNWVLSGCVVLRALVLSAESKKVCLF